MSIELGPVVFIPPFNGPGELFPEADGPGEIFPEDAITEAVAEAAEVAIAKWEEAAPDTTASEPAAAVPTELNHTTTPAKPDWRQTRLVELRHELADLDCEIADTQAALKLLRKRHKDRTGEYQKLQNEVADAGGEEEDAGDASDTADAGGEGVTPADSASPPLDAAPTNPTKTTNTTPLSPPPLAVTALRITLTADVEYRRVAAENPADANYLAGRAGETIEAWRDAGGDVFAAAIFPEHGDGTWTPIYLLPSQEPGDEGSYDSANVVELGPAEDHPPTAAMRSADPPTDGVDQPADEKDDWRSTTVEELGIPTGICSILREHNSIATLGQLADFSKDGAPLTMLRKIGEAKAEVIEKATETYWANHPVPVE